MLVLDLVPENSSSCALQYYKSYVLFCYAGQGGSINATSVIDHIDDLFAAVATYNKNVRTLLSSFFIMSSENYTFPLDSLLFVWNLRFLSVHIFPT